jgi:hypothetical protein
VRVSGFTVIVAYRASVLQRSYDYIGRVPNGYGVTVDVHDLYGDLNIQITVRIINVHDHVAPAWNIRLDPLKHCNLCLAKVRP